MSYVKEAVKIPPGAWVGMMQGHFTKDVAAVGDPAFVAVPAFSNTGMEEVEWGPCVWPPAWGASLPKRGDTALILFDNMRVPWVISWVPSVYVPAGTGGSDLKYTFTQASPATTWTITHNLHVFPVIVVVDNTGAVIEADIVYNSNNQITVTFATAQAGKAYLS